MDDSNVSMGRRVLLSAFVVLFLLLSGFLVLPAHDVEAAANAADRTVTIALQQDMENFNYFDLSSNSVWKANVLGLNFEGLAGIDYDLQPFPDLATGWTTNVNTLTVTVTLRQGVTFSDGTPLTADDVLFSYYTLRYHTTYSSFIVDAFGDTSSGKIYFPQIQAGVVKLDAQTIQFKMRQSYGAFFTNTLSIPIIPKAIWASHTVDENSTSTAKDWTQGGVVDVTWNTDPKAAIGTGPLMYDSGVAKSYRVEKVNQNYWGKTTKTPQGYALWPKNVDTVRFKIYSSLDTAILALQAGDVDHLPWALTPGQIPVLAANPSIKLTYTRDNGYFYLAFNEKRKPMNFLAFRQAVSYLIDKQTIVERYMGGFGQPGDANEPPFWGSGWYNSSVHQYPFDGTFQTTITTLTNGGFHRNTDGSWTMPDGTALPPLIILTPPATYDPIRVRVGQMVAQNLNAIGISATAQAIDFSLLVARLNSFSYDMLTLGWQLTSDPVDNVFFSLGPAESQNNYAFWSTANDNPFYSGIGEVSTYADAATQAYANQVAQLEQTAKGTFDVATQQKYTKWAEGVAADAVPFNVLYYRTNTFATRTSWTGWTPFLGQLWSNANFFSLGSLSRQAVAPPTGVVNGHITAPPALIQGMTSGAVIVAQDGNGFPLPGVTVTVTTTGKTSASPSSGTTDANGEFRFQLTATTPGFDYVNATLTSGTTTATVTSLVEVKYKGLPPTLALTAVPTKRILNVSESTTITLKVKDQAGLAVAGATVTVDTKTIGRGTVTPSSGSVTTDSTGTATMTFNALSAADLNTHMLASLSFTATSGALTSNLAQLNLLTYNRNPSVWRFVTVESVSHYVLNSTANTTAITVRATNETGAALTNERIAVVYGNSSLLVGPQTSITTNATGYATVSLKVRAGAPTPKGLRVTFKNVSVANSVSDTLTLLYVNPSSLPQDTFAGLISFSNPRITGAFGSLDMTIKLVAADGSTTPNTDVAVVLAASTSGQLMDLYVDQDATTQRPTAAQAALGFNLTYNTLDDFAGLLVKTSLDDTSLTTGGIFSANVDQTIDWTDATDPDLYGAGIGDFFGNADYNANLHNVNVTSGQVTLTMVGIGSALADRANDVYVVPKGVLRFDDYTLVGTGYGTLNYILNGNTTIGGQYVVTRNPKALAFKESFDHLVMRTLSTYGPTTTKVSVTVTDQTGAPVKGATIKTYQRQNSGGTLFGDSFVCPGCKGVTATAPTTDATGKATVTLTANPVTVPTIANLYIRVTKSGYQDLFDQYNVFIYPVGTVVTVSSDIYTLPVTGTPYRHGPLQGTSVVTAQIFDEKGNPLPNTPLDLSASQGLVAPLATDVSDANGQVNYMLALSTLDPNTTAVDVRGSLTQPGFAGSQAVVSLVKYVPPSVIGLVTPSHGATVTQADKITIVGFVQNPNGITGVKIRVDGTDADYVSLAAPSGAAYSGSNPSWTFNYDVTTALQPGTHTVYVQATDAYGVVTTYSDTFTVAGRGAQPVFSSDIAGTIALVGLALAAVTLALFMFFRMKGGGPSKPEDVGTIEPTDKR